MKKALITLLGGLLIMTAMGACSAETEAEKKEEGPKVFMACETYSLRSLLNDGTYDFVTIMPLMKELGMKGVALNDIWLRSFDEEYLDTIKAAAKENDLIICALICEGNLATDNEEARRKQIEVNAQKMRAAAYLGAPLVRLNLGGTGSEERDATVGVQRVIEAFNELLPLAKELNVKITIENHGGVSKKADWILEIIKGTDPKWVGACLDFKNWPKELIYEENAKLAAYSFHTHAKAHSFDENGEETTVDYKRVLQMLKDAKYKGAISIEFEGPGDQIEGVKKTRDLILRYWEM